MNHQFTAACCCLTILTAVSLVSGYSNGTLYQGVTGAPGENTCAECHGNLNTGSGQCAISAPGEYSPGDTLEITVTVSHAGQKKWGFEFTALDGSDQPVGNIIVTDTDRTVSTVGLSGRQYISQTTLGSADIGGNSSYWSFKWVAPESSSGQITFYVAGVAGDEASGPNGDYTYTTTHVMLATSVSELLGTDLPADFRLQQNYPNPFNPCTIIEFSLPRRADIELAIFNVLGQKVRTLHKGALAAGNYRTEWDGCRDDGRQSSSGVFFYRLRDNEHSLVGKMILVR